MRPIKISDTSPKQNPEDRATPTWPRKAELAWNVRTLNQLEDELSRMRLFDRDAPSDEL